jgi:predicted Fe-S protein YdhL (DUF1289 family)
MSDAPPPFADPPSPCVRICALDPSGTWCVGCGRTLREIGRWSSLSPDDKRAVLADLPRRMGRA